MTKAAQFTGAIPETYDAALGPVLFEGYAEEMARRAEATGAANVLELAAGTGILTVKLRAALPNARVVASDLNAPMLDIARSKLKGARHIEFQTADAMALPFDDRSFDLIVCQFGVMFFPDKIQAFREAKRVLKPGGTYLFNVWGPLSANRFAEITDELGRAVLPANPPQFYRTPFGYSDQKQVSADLAAGGFTKLAWETVRITQRIADWGAFARGLVYGNPFASELEAGDVRADEVVVQLAEKLTARYGAAPASLPLEAIVITVRA
jgi:ubiquinone/menaquinone biosynthesis C-methylase UbiE